MFDFKVDVEKLLASDIKDRYWYANKVLYDLCEKNPDYNGFNADSFVAKLWIIGRSYAAAVERRERVNIERLAYNDDYMEYAYEFYYDEVSKAIEKCPEYFELINNLKDIDDIDEKSIPTILKVHKVLTSVFINVSGKDKRSLASKYLHFHFPKLFFIYDSRASTEIKKYFNTGKETNSIKGTIQYDNGFDKEYYDFYLKCYFIYKEYKDYADSTKDGIEKTFPRLIDSVLLVSAARSAEHKRKEMLTELKNGEYDEAEKKKTDSAIEIYKSKTLRDELVQYLKENYSYNKDILKKIDKRWNKVSKEDE